MKKTIVDTLVCPIHKTSLILKEAQQTHTLAVKSGALFCNHCGADVASIKHGKADFLRVKNLDSNTNSDKTDEFYYKRIGWNHQSVQASHCEQIDVGWNAEGYWGCLQAKNSADWSITLSTDATDLSLRFLSNHSCGRVAINVNNNLSLILDLYSQETNDIEAYEIFKNLPGSKTIVVKGAVKNPASLGEQIRFFGMDATFIGVNELKGANRGNGYPSAYQWVLDHLPPEVLVLDCGSGDRKFSDDRVISFEYMPFELPDVFGDGHALPFADASFDAVFSQAVMEHMRDPYLAAREISRVLKPGGLVYVESAFMQPLHAVPYHFFNTTTWGIEAIFNDADIATQESEWFGPISSSVEWYINSCGGGNLTKYERRHLQALLLKVDANVSYQQLKPIASAVSFWGIKNGAKTAWVELVNSVERPSFKYAISSQQPEQSASVQSQSLLSKIAQKSQCVLQRISKKIRD